MNSDFEPRLEELLILRAKLLGNMARMEDDSMNDHRRTVSVPTDVEELASDGANQEIMLALLGSDEDTLDRIEAAIQRVKGGEYGRCGQCGEPISQNRLDAVPYAPSACAAHREGKNTESTDLSYCLCPVGAYNDCTGRVAAHLIATLQRNCRKTR